MDERIARVLKVSAQQPPQRSAEWLKRRLGFITASELASVLRLSQHEIDLRTNGVVELPSEKKVGQVVPAYNSYASLLRSKVEPQPFNAGSVEMEWGVAYEHIITGLYASFTDTSVHETNLIPHSTIDFLAASPDGISSSGRMIEIKCPYSRQPSGKPKLQYWMQMQLQLECCDLDVCDFLDVVVHEYGNRETYLLDTYNDDNDDCNDPNIYNRNAAGLPKGFIIDRSITNNITGHISHKYYYPPVLTFANRREEDKWLDNWVTSIRGEFANASNERWLHFLNGHTETYHIRYWYIAEWICVPVERDRKWFAKRLPDLKDFWQLVIQYRKDGLPTEIKREDSIEPKLTKQRSSRIQIEEKCMFE